MAKQVTVLQLDNLSGEILNEYSSLSSAANAVGCSSSLIRGACVFSHRGHTARGYRWVAINKETGKEHYGYGKYFSSTNENLTIEEINNIVNKKMESSLETKKRNFNNRANSFGLKCNKCNTTGKINKSSTLNTLKGRDDIEISSENGCIRFTCLICNTSIELK